MLTRVFKSGNSLAVRIPVELVMAGAGAGQDVEIERQGDALLILNSSVDSCGTDAR